MSALHPHPEPIALPDGASPPQALQVLDVAGSGLVAGERYGEGCRELIQQHFDQVLARLSRSRGLAAEAAYYPHAV